LLLCFPAIRSIQLASEIRNDTRRQMTEWMSQNLPAGTRILLSGGTTYLARVPQKLQGVTLRKKIGRENDHLIERLKNTHFDYILTTNLTTDRFSTNVAGRAKEKSNALKEIEKQLPLAHRIAPKFGSYGFHNPVHSLYSLKEPATTKEEVPAGGGFELSHPPGWGVK
jgi:hypothetical protein